MAEDWALNVKKYEASADDGVIAGIVRYCGIALQKRDSSLVSFGDPVETGRVRENFLKKKLGLTHSDADLDAAIAKVGEQMKGESFRNRVTVYYLLAQHFDLLHTFGKAGAAKVETIAQAPTTAPVEDSNAKAMPLAAAGVAGATAAVSGVAGTVGSATSSAVGTAGAVAAGALGGAAAIAGSVGNTVTGTASSAAQALTGGFGDDDSKSGMGWLPWLLGILALLLAVWWFFLRNPAEAPAAVPVATETALPAAVETTVAAPAEGTVAIPAGAGVTSETRDGKPVVKVYFDTAKADIVEAFTPASAGLKSYLDTHAGSTLAVTGFADKRGNAAANAALSKRRAEAVKAALVSSGIAEASIELVKPSDAVDASENLAGARRVEVVVR